jgi:hypothetical protein
MSRQFYKLHLKGTVFQAWDNLSDQCVGAVLVHHTKILLAIHFSQEKLYASIDAVASYKPAFYCNVQDFKIGLWLIT